MPPPLCLSSPDQYSASPLGCPSSSLCISLCVCVPFHLLCPTSASGFTLRCFGGISWYFSIYSSIRTPLASAPLFISWSVSVPWSLGVSQSPAPNVLPLSGYGQRAWRWLALTGCVCGVGGGSQVTWGREIARDAQVRRTSGIHPRIGGDPLSYLPAWMELLGGYLVEAPSFSPGDFGSPAKPLAY